MKLLVIFLAIIGLCAGGALPVIPGDNSHYVEGESRYIWMPDGKGVPQLVDLEAPIEVFVGTRNAAENEYWLFTRENPTSHQLLVNGNADSILNSNYRKDRPTKVIAHGWFNNGGSEVNTAITAAFLENANVNVIVLDWSTAANQLYTSSVGAVPEVGRQLADFLDFLFTTAGGSWSTVHLVGHSLGAHVVGNAGRAASSPPVRVTGMDPAGPLWGGNPDALNISSGIFVESIHTDGGILGMLEPISHADFYPNGGTNPQPGCLTSLCSHGRSHEFFASSVKTDHFVGKRCTNLQQARNVKCSGDTLNMGNTVLDKRGFDIYGLQTGSSWPF